MVPGHTACVEMAQAKATEASFLKTCPGNIAKIGNEAGCAVGQSRRLVGGKRDSQKRGREPKHSVGIKSLTSEKLGCSGKELKPHGW